MLLRRRRGSVRPRARRGRLRRWSRAGGRARKASAPILACGAPGGVPSRAPGEGCCPPWPSAKKLSRAGGESGKSIEHNSPRGGRRKAGNRFDSENLARMMTVSLRAANDSHSTPRACARLVSELHDACDASETRHHVPGGRCLREVRGDGSRRDARAKAAPDTSFFVFCYLVRVSRIFARKKTRRRDPRSARARALVADTPILPPAPVPPAVARAPSSRAPRPSAAAPPRPRARANAHRKTDGSSAKTPSQRRGSRAMAPRGGRACPAENAEWNPTRGNL